MSRRNVEMFNLSFLDVLSGALGAIIFLFIITPKGGQPASKMQQVVVSIDTLHNQLFGTLHDSLSNKSVGDTLLVLIGDFKKMPSVDDCPSCPPPVVCAGRIKCPTCPKCKTVEPPDTDDEDIIVASEDDKTGKKQDPVPEEEKPKKTSKYEGDPPSVPCKVSFEVNWEDGTDNVDFMVCKGGSCVYGASGKRENPAIGSWDSGKSKTKLFGSDLRTTQEAVRQFNKIIPGTYKLYAQFKASDKNNKTVRISGLIYSKDGNASENGERFTQTLTLNTRDKTFIGTVELKDNGQFKFSKN